MNVKTKDLTQYFDFKIWVKQIEGITDTGLEQKFATGLDWLFLANARLLISGRARLLISKKILDRNFGYFFKFKSFLIKKYIPRVSARMSKDY